MIADALKELQEKHEREVERLREERDEHQAHDARAMLELESKEQQLAAANALLADCAARIRPPIVLGERLRDYLAGQAKAEPDPTANPCSPDAEYWRNRRAGQAKAEPNLCPKCKRERCKISVCTDCDVSKRTAAEQRVLEALTDLTEEELLTQTWGREVVNAELARREGK